MTSKFRLKGNASFTLRDGWLTKGLMAVSKDSKVFRKNSGMDVLGVGSAMAVSIRYWLRACGLTEEIPSGGVRLSWLGRLVLEHDPYLSDYFTWWVLHYELVTNPELSTVFYLFFNRMEDCEFDREGLVESMEELILDYAGTDDFSVKTMADDCGVLINMYARTRNPEDDPEDNLVSPFSELGLLAPVRKKWKRKCPDYRRLPKEAVLYMLERQSAGEGSLRIEEILSGERSVGKVCCLSRVMLNEYLDELESTGSIYINRTAGLDVVYLAEKLSPEGIVESYYEEHGGE